MLSKEYVNWLYKKFGTPGYKEIFNKLGKIDYIYQMVLDASRADIAKQYRKYFSYETGVYPDDIADNSCSVLEVFCSIAEDMSTNSCAGSPQSFLREIFSNLHLTSSNCEAAIYKWLYRQYEPNGKGSIFYIPNTKVDLRNLTIWDQMVLYLNTYYPLDENFLKEN